MRTRFFQINSLKLAILLLLCSITGTIPPAAAQTSVTVMPPSASVRTGLTFQFFSGVSGSANQAVVWSVNSINGGNASVGTISVGGLYQAPAQLPAPNIVTIRATSVANS